MKIIHCVPPFLVLLIAAAWLAHLRRSNSSLEQDNALLRKKISESRDSGVRQNARAGIAAGNGEKPSGNETRPSAEWVSTSRNWKELILFNSNESSDRHRYTAAWKRLETLASEMSGEELATAYTEMTALPVNAEMRRDLERLMLPELTKKNPEFAFSQYIANYQREEKPPPMGGFDGWLAGDPAAATAWYERQLAAGVFDKSLDGKSPAKLLFESAFIKSLLASDPAAAGQRMKDIPADLRGSLGGYLRDIPKENGAVFVDLLRKTMPMEEYMAILRNNSLTEYNFSLSSDKDPESVRKNLESLGVTPEERSTLMVQQFIELAQDRAMRDKGNIPSREKFDGWRTWIQAIDPSSADRATGAALQSYLEKSNTTGAQDFVGKIASDYHDAGAGDELLIPLIEGSANGSVSFAKDRARLLATKISDEKLRAELLQKLD